MVIPVSIVSWDILKQPDKDLSHNPQDGIAGNPPRLFVSEDQPSINLFTRILTWSHYHDESLRNTS